MWLSYLADNGPTPTINPQPWYPTKHTPSFADAIAELRRALWRERISPATDPHPLSPEMATLLIEALAMAA